MTALTRMSLLNRLIVGMVTAAVMVSGIVATTKLNQETMPSISTPVIVVGASLPGASPEVVEDTVTAPLETALMAIPDVDSVTTETTPGSMYAEVWWPFDADEDQLEGEVRRAVDGAAASLPDSAETEVISASMDAVPVVSLAVSSATGEEDLSSRVESGLVPELESLPGVATVDLSGQREQEVSITLDSAQAEEHGIAAPQIMEAIEAAGTVTPGGSTTENGRSLSVEVGSELDAVETVAETPLQTEDGPIVLADVADVELAQVEQTSLSRANGADALSLSVTKTPQANVVEVSHAVADAIDAASPQLGEDVEFTTIFDQAPDIEQSIHDLSVEGGLGLLFAVLVILAFLGTFRSTIIAAISIPMSLLIAMIGLWVGEYTLNLLTLGALTIAVGRVVDDSIVVIENIRRRQGMSELTVEDIVASVRQVAGAVTASTLTAVAVFLPIVFVSGIAGQLFRPFAITVSLAMVASLLVSLTIVPTLAYWFLRHRPRPLSPARQERSDARYAAWREKQEAKALRRQERKNARIEKANAKREAKGRAPRPLVAAASVVEPYPTGEASGPIDRLQQGFLPTIQAALRHPGRTLGISAVVLVLTLVLATFLKTDLLGEQGQTSLYVTQELEDGTSLEVSDEAAQRVEEVLAEDPDIEDYLSTIGGGGGMMGGGGGSNSFTVTLAEDAEPQEATARLSDALSALEDAGEVSVGGASQELSEDVTINLTGQDPQAIEEAAQELTEQAAALPGVAEASHDLAGEQPVLSVDVDREVAADYGFTQAEVGQAIAAALQGVPAGTLTLEGTERDIRIAPTHPDASPEEIANLELPVSQRQTQQAQEEAQDSIDERMDARAAEAEREAEEANREAMDQAIDMRDQAADQVQELEDQLDQLRNPGSGPPPEQPDPAAELEDALADARDGLQEAEDGIADLRETQEQQRQEQEEQEALADEQEAVPDITGSAITVDALADVEEVQTAPSISRAEGERQATVSVTPEAGQLSAVSAAVAQLEAEADLPAGVSFAVAGAAEDLMESFSQLGLAMLAAIVLVLMVMIGTFRSIVQPLVLLVSIPFAATGAVLLLVITQIPLGIPSMIGLLMLIGIVVTNAIVLIDLINKFREGGMELMDAVLHGTRLRLRPILMTAAATIFALVPMSLGLTGGGVFISQPLAIVVIGGLTSSTLLTLVLVPVLYYLTERAKERRRERSVRRKESKAAMRASREALAAGDAED
ncbi:efflux RND transporter permease subunit [Brevibacterium album]|uniref:efflux RND transporter permease subunit n=1 Tax=Brevibacterium album TaxID=417948 RepID=UPI00048AE617|nr:efflux RND transporter permease subunit [Brevibacterium album]